MCRFALMAIVLVGLGALLFGGVGAAGAMFALLLAPVLFFAKIVLFVMLFGVLARMFWRSGGRGPAPREWRARPPRPSERRPSEAERFDEWHRMAHAREEVDSWVPESEL